MKDLTERLKAIQDKLPESLRLDLENDPPLCGGWGLNLLDDCCEGSALFIVRGLKALDFVDLNGLGPPVVAELAYTRSFDKEGKPGCFVRRVVCPENDTSHVSQQGEGTTMAQAVGEALYAVFKEAKDEQDR